LEQYRLDGAVLLRSATDFHTVSTFEQPDRGVLDTFPNRDAFASRAVHYYAATRAATPTAKAVNQPPDEVALARVALLNQDICEPTAHKALLDPVHVFRH
jgi:hypothetical protein